MSATFTDGPYRVMKIAFAKGDWASLLDDVSGIDVVVSGGGDVVAAVWADDDSDEVAQANLFAAAPELLEALEAHAEAQRLTDEHVEMIEYHAAHGMDDPTGHSHVASAGKRADEARAKAVQLRDTAIAKARGAQS